MVFISGNPNCTTEQLKIVKIFVYKMTTDNGGAPCPWRGVLSLAICKPRIRKSAEEGNLIFGFGAKSHEERLIYFATVTKKLNPGEYYRNRRYANRPDCIYDCVAGAAQLKSDARFHTKTDQRKKDVGFHFENAYVLLSNDFCYFGDKATTDYKQHFPAIKRMVEGLSQNHLVNHSCILYGELSTLSENLRQNRQKMKIGSPRDADHSCLCNAETPSCEVF